MLHQQAILEVEMGNVHTVAPVYWAAPTQPDRKCRVQACIIPEGKANQYQPRKVNDYFEHTAV
jgi:hypothetical protein